MNFPGKEYEGVAGGVYRLVDDRKTFDWFYERAKEQPKLVLDTETSGLAWVKHSPCGVVIGWGPEHNYYIAIDHKDHVTGQRIPNQLNWLDIFQDMKVLLENPELTIYYHNGKFDQHMMANLGVWPTGPFHDSLTSSFLLDENVSHALKDLSKLYVDENADIYEERIEKWRNDEAKRRRSELRAMIKAEAATYKEDKEYVAQVTKQALTKVDFKLDENGKAEKGAKAALTRAITAIMVERASKEFEDHYYQQNSIDDISYDLIPLDEITPYACADVHYTWNLNELFLPIIAENEQFFDLYIAEITFSKELFNIEREGVKINRSYLESCGPELEAEAARLEKAIYKQIGYEFNISSPDQLVKALEAAGCDLRKLTKGSREKVEKTGNVDFAKFATDSEVMEELGAKYQFAKDIVDYRRALKIKGTYVDGILSKLDKDNRVHCWFNGMVKTGRTSSKDPNLTNIDNKDTRIRKAFEVPDEDHYMVFMDFSQIELRLTAHESKDPELLSCYPMEGNGKDVHSLTCAEVIMNVSYEEFLQMMEDEAGHDDHNIVCECNKCVCDFKRKIAKRVNFGIIYGAGKYAIQRQVSTPKRYVSADECGRYIDSYLNKYGEVKRWIDEVGYQLKRDGSVQNAFGRYRRLPDILVTQDNKYKYRMMRQAVNFKIQGMAADIFKTAINRVGKLTRGTGIKTVNIVHDELQFYWPKDKLHMIPAVKKELEDFNLLVPVVADVSYSDSNWAVKKKMPKEMYETV